MNRMLYMVEMALLDTARRAEWEAWYVAHQHRLLSIPGIHAPSRAQVRIRNKHIPAPATLTPTSHPHRTSFLANC